MEVYISGSVRTPIGNFLGSLSSVPTVKLGVECAKETLRRSEVIFNKIQVKNLTKKFLYSILLNSSSQHRNFRVAFFIEFANLFKINLGFPRQR